MTRWRAGWRRYATRAAVAAALVVFAVAGFGLTRWGLEVRREKRLETQIAHAAARYGVEAALVKAVVWRESRFREDARGAVGELGLMQVGALAGEDWARSERLRNFKHTDLLDPERNLSAGAWYLSHLLRRYAHTDNPTVYALADYNAGRVQMLRWTSGPARTNSEAFLRAMDYPGTRKYVQAVMERRERYRAEAGR
jgi:soluble lytic murein transglycosylase